jgi:tRNA(fMet)-specific endonuclease VapC
MEILSVDTCLLIDLEREQRRGSSGRAHAFLEEHRTDEFRLSAVALGEFAAGFARRNHPRVEMVRRAFGILPLDEETGLIYGEVYRSLKAQGTPIGANDLWIAATALRHDLPLVLVTANLREFSRVPGLKIVEY